MARGRRPLPWIKLWFDILGDPKMTRLSSSEKWCWVGMLLLAGQSPTRGKLMLTDTEPMTIDDIARGLHLLPDEVQVLESCISKLVNLKALCWNEHNCLEVINFTKRQGPPQYMGESQASITQREKPIKEALIKLLWDNQWLPTSEEIVNVESEKRIGNLYIDIVAKTKTNHLILMEVKPFSLQPAHLGQVMRYFNALKEQTSMRIFPFLIGRDRRNVDDDEARSMGISLLTFDDLPLDVGATVPPTVIPTLAQQCTRPPIEGRGERKEVEVEEEEDKKTPKGVRKKRTDPQSDPRVKEVFDKVKTFFGHPGKTGGKDPIPNYGMEGQAIKRMFTRGFTRDEILACWRSKVSRRGGEFVSMKWVNQDIGDFVRGGEPLPDRTKQGTNDGGFTREKLRGGEFKPEGRIHGRPGEHKPSGKPYEWEEAPAESDGTS